MPTSDLDPLDIAAVGLAAGAAALGYHDSSRDSFRFEAGPYRAEQFRVVGFRGREEISGLYGFTVDVAARDVEATTLESVLLGQPASLDIGLPGKAPRMVHGVVHALGFHGVFPATHEISLRVKIVPRLALLRHTKNTRIFQDMSVPEIVRAVLRLARIEHKWKLAQKYPKRVYCVQYRESDYAFVTRLLAEEGIFFFFEHPDAPLGDLLAGAGGVVGNIAAAASVLSGSVGEAAGAVARVLGVGESVIFADVAQAYPPIAGGAGVDISDLAFEAMAATGMDDELAQALAPTGLHVGLSPSLVYREGEGMLPDERYVSDFSARRAVRTKYVLMRDYDFKRPRLDLRAPASVTPLSGGAVSVGLGLGGGGITLTGAAGLGLPLAIDPNSLRVYDHHGEDEDPDVTRQKAHVLLEQLRSRSAVGVGTSWCRRLLPGRRFTLEEHADGRLNREWVVTRVHHEGRADGRVGGLEDPSQKDQSYHNRFEVAPAEVPVRPPPTEHPSVQTLETAIVVGPVGEEIFTDEFGRIKVQFHWDLQGKRNEFSSCWMRVAQSWAGGSWGTQFIPRIGMEVLVSFLSGDQDRPVVIGCLYNGENPPAFNVPTDRTRSGWRTQSSPGAGGYNELSFEDRAGGEQVFLRAQRDLDETVGRDHTQHVQRDDKTTVDHDHEVTVRFDQRVAVGGQQSLTVTGNQQVQVSIARTTMVGASDYLSVGKHSFLSVRENANVQVGRYFNTYVGTKEDPGGVNYWAWGPYVLGTDKTLTLSAAEEILLKVGDTTLRMTPTSLVIDAKSIVIAGAEDVTVRAKGPAWKLTDVAHLVAKEITLQSKGVTTKMDASVFKVMAPSTILTSGSGADTDERKIPAGETRPFIVKLTNESFGPFANRPYELTVGTTRLSGTTTGEGRITEQVPKTATHATLLLWVGEPPTGDTRTWSFELVEEIPPVSSIVGLKQRLKNLGYFFGEIDAEVTEGLGDAIRLFQQDHDLELSGIAADVQGRVHEVHGS